MPTIRELDGIVEQIQQDLPEARLVSRKRVRQDAGDFDIDVECLGAGVAPNDGGALLRQGFGSEGQSLELDRPCFRLRKVQEVVDDRQESGARGSDELGMALDADRQFTRIEHEIREADNAVEGRPDLVTDDGQEIAFRLAGLFGRALRSFGEVFCGL